MLLQTIFVLQCVGVFIDPAREEVRLIAFESSGLRDAMTG